MGVFFRYFRFVAALSLPYFLLGCGRVKLLHYNVHLKIYEKGKERKRRWGRKKRKGEGKEREAEGGEERSC